MPSIPFWKKDVMMIMNVLNISYLGFWMSSVFFKIARLLFLLQS